MPKNPNKARCQQPGCRAWAVRDSSPPLCAAHGGRKGGAPPGNQNALTHGFYASTLNPDELADLDVIGQLAGDTTLDAEVVITRIALRRLLHMFQTGITPGPNPQPLTAQDYTNVIGLAFRGCGTLSRLLRARKDLGGEQSDAFHAFIDEALDLLSEEWNCQL
jgi:hypothetical protein